MEKTEEELIEASKQKELLSNDAWDILYEIFGDCNIGLSYSDDRQLRAITYNYNLKELIPKQTRARKIFPNGHLDSDECGYVFYTGMTENEEGYMIPSETLKGKSRI